MSYVKPQQSDIDTPIGFRTVNQLSDNQAAIKTLLEVEHLPGKEPQTFDVGNAAGGPSLLSPPDLNVGGQHETPKVARGVMMVESDPSNLFAVAGSPFVRARFHSGSCVNLQRMQTGLYFVPISGFAEFYAEVTPEADDNTVTRIAQQAPTTVVISASTPPQPGIFVSTWEETTLLSSNVGFAPADFNFMVTVYGRRSSAWVPGEDGFPYPISIRPPRRRTSPRSRVFFVKV
jgi:hypothetical protein